METENETFSVCQHFVFRVQLEQFLGKYPGHMAKGEPESSERSAKSTVKSGRNCKVCSYFKVVLNF